MQNEDIKLENEDLVLATTTTSFQPGGSSAETGEAPSAKKEQPQSMNFASEDLPPCSVPIDAVDVSAKLAFLRSSMTDLHAKFSIIQTSIHNLLMISTRESNS